MTENQRVRPKTLKQEGEVPEWEDKISNRIVHWHYSDEQIHEMQQALEAKSIKSIGNAVFYPDYSVKEMREVWYRNA